MSGQTSFARIIEKWQKERGPLRITELGELIGWEQSRLSHQLRRMEQRGLVTRELCTEDNRSSVIRITDAGRALVCSARAQYDEAVRRWPEDNPEMAKMVVHGQVIPQLLRASQLVEWNGYAYGEDDPYAVPAWWKKLPR